MLNGQRLMISIALLRIGELKENWFTSRHFTRKVIVQSLITNIKIVLNYGTQDDIECLVVRFEKFGDKLLKQIKEADSVLFYKLHEISSAPFTPKLLNKTP